MGTRRRLDSREARATNRYRTGVRARLSVPRTLAIPYWKSRACKRAPAPTKRRPMDYALHNSFDRRSMPAHKIHTTAARAKRIVRLFPLRHSIRSPNYEGIANLHRRSIRYVLARFLRLRQRIDRGEFPSRRRCGRHRSCRRVARLRPFGDDDDLLHRARIRP